jgi:8-oxo-dGTP diphosphatase
MKRVVAALIEHDGKILVTRRKEGQSHAGFWEFPGGKIEGGETAEQALRREILEELGLEIDVGTLFATNQFDYKDFRIELLAYEATNPRGELVLVVHDKAEFVEVEKLLEYSLTAADVPIAQAYVERNMERGCVGRDPTR